MKIYRHIQAIHMKPVLNKKLKKGLPLGSPFFIEMFPPFYRQCRIDKIDADHPYDMAYPQKHENCYAISLPRKFISCSTTSFRYGLVSSPSRNIKQLYRHFCCRSPFRIKSYPMRQRELHASGFNIRLQDPAF